MNAFLEKLWREQRSSWLYEELEFVRELALLDRINVNFLTVENEQIAINRLKLAQAHFDDLQCVLGSVVHMCNNNRPLLERQINYGTLKTLNNLAHRLHFLNDSMEIMIKMFDLNFGGDIPAECYLFDDLGNSTIMLNFVVALAKRFCPTEMDRYNVFYPFLDGVQYMLMESVGRTMQWCKRLETKETKREWEKFTSQGLNGGCKIGIFIVQFNTSLIIKGRSSDQSGPSVDLKLVGKPL